MPTEPGKLCNFCGRPRNEVKDLVTAKDGSGICDTCLTGAQAMLDEKARKAGGEPASNKAKPVKKPREIKGLLDLDVISQDDAKRAVAIAVYKHYRRREVDTNRNGKVLLDGEEITIEKSNILLLGPTGSGKTHIARTAAKMLGVPFFVGDATRLTQAGYMGDDVESLLQGLMADAQQDVEKAQWGIIFLDETDKLARKSGRSTSGSRDVTGEGVQQALLKLIEGCQVAVPRGMGSRMISGQNPMDTIDTTNILFICAGSFAGIEPIIEKRLNKSAGIGFGVDSRGKFENTALYRSATVEDIEEFGLLPEFVGRLPVLTSTYELTEPELIRVLTEPKNSICKQFRALFSLDGIDLQFEQAALVAVAQEAKKRGTGARALRTILEKVLEPYSFDAPDSTDLSTIRITAESVAKPGTALMVRKAVGTA